MIDLAANMQPESGEQDDFETAIGQLLVERGKLDGAALERALRIRNSSNEGLDRLLPKLGLATERDVAQACGVVRSRRCSHRQ